MHAINTDRLALFAGVEVRDFSMLHDYKFFNLIQRNVSRAPLATCVTTRDSNSRVMKKAIRYQTKDFCIQIHYPG